LLATFGARSAVLSASRKPLVTLLSVASERIVRAWSPVARLAAYWDAIETRALYRP
jgi:hypothetical protein